MTMGRLSSTKTSLPDRGRFEPQAKARQSPGNDDVRLGGPGLSLGLISSRLGSGPVSPITESDRHDVPRPIDKPVPGVAAVINDVSSDLKIRLDSQLAGKNCQTFSCGFSSGHFAGRSSGTMLFGTSRMAARCQPS